MPEIVQEIGAAAGLAAVAGLAVLSVLYFSQARDVKRLREWAGRAPERAATTAPVVPGRVQAQPQPKPAQPVAGAPAPPGAPAPAQGAVPGGTAATAAGAASAAAAGAAAPEAQKAADSRADDAAKEETAGDEAQPAAAAPSTGDGDGKPDGTDVEAADADAPDAPPAAAPAGADRDAVDDSADEAAAADSSREPAGDADDAADEAPVRPGVPAVAASAAGAAAASATQTKAPPGEGGNAEPATPPSAPGGPGPSTPAGGRPPGAPPPVPAGQRVAPGQRPGAAGQRRPARPMLPPRPMPQQTAIIPPPRRPWYRSLLGSPRYLVLAIAGLLILGGAGAFAVAELTSDDTGGSNEPRQIGNGGGDGGEEPQNNDGQGQRQPIAPADVTVAVLNGTTVPNLARGVSERVESHGFEVGTVANTADQQQQRAESVVLYAPGHEREATAVSRRLAINQRQPIDPASQELAGDATVVVIAGADLAQ